MSETWCPGFSQGSQHVWKCQLYSLEGWVSSWKSGSKWGLAIEEEMSSRAGQAWRIRVRSHVIVLIGALGCQPGPAIRCRATVSVTFQSCSWALCRKNQQTSSAPWAVAVEGACEARNFCIWGGSAASRKSHALFRDSRFLSWSHPDHPFQSRRGPTLPQPRAQCCP